LAGWKHAGIGRYVENLILELPKLSETIAPGRDLTWVLFFHDAAQAAEIGESWPENVELVFAPVRHYTLMEQWHMPQIFAHQKLDLLHVPHFNIPWLYFGKICITIHDLLWHEQRGSHVTTLKPWVYWLKYGLYLATVWFALMRAKIIFVPAETIKQTVLRYYPSVSEKIVVTPEGLGKTYVETAAALRQKNLELRTAADKKQQLRLVYTGSLYPHKNVSLILKALTHRPAWHLTIVGSRSNFQDQIKQQVTELGIETQVRFAGFLPDDELIKLYQASDALVQPSLSEGFGLTGVEALAAGTVLLASDIPIFREVYGDAAIFFNPESVSHFLLAADQLAAQTQGERRALLQRGLTQIKHYDWAAMALITGQQYFAAYA
jgi:glycosyltransferase involved in cell wall biosynthesis